MKIYSTTAQATFAKRLAKLLKARYSEGVGLYPDGQIYVNLREIPDNERVVVVGNTFGSHEYEELRLLIHTLRRENVRDIIVVLPYLGGSRQDRAKVEGQDVAAKLQAEEISALKPDRVLLMDLHHGSILYFFDDAVHTRVLHAEKVFLGAIKALKLKNFACVAPDAGRFTLAQHYAKHLGVEAVSLDKRREGPGKAAIFHVVGDVAGKDAILLDDIIDSGGTVIAGAEAIRAAGATSVHLFATHLVLSGESWKKFTNHNVFDSMHATDTIDTTAKKHKFKIHSVVSLFADYIKNVAQSKGRV